jgi:hypothetical protein
MATLKEHYQRLKSDVIKAKSAPLVVAFALPRFFRERMTPQQAEEETKRLLNTRVERFLELVRTQVYEHPDSVYLRLLKHAGCEFADFQAQVHQHGLEKTLVKLATEGVYLTSDEYKGKRDVVRGRLSFRVYPRDFEPKVTSAGFTIASSGTSNAPVSTFSSLEWRALRIIGTAITYAAHDVFSRSYAVYQPILSGRVGAVLIRGKIGIATDRWFAPKLPINSWLEGKYHYLSTCWVLMMANWFGPGIAKPEFLEPGDVRPIVEWVLQKKREGRKCCIRTVYSNAVRIARCALEMGVALEGTIFDGGGEPLTDSKRALMERAGARVLTHYAFGGNVSAGLGCSHPAFTDEVHVHQSLLALVENPKPLDPASSLPIYPLMGTTLHPSAPRLLLNVENGDYGIMVRRDCGCVLERVGFTQHLYGIRSFEKLTCEGMNYGGTDLFELLEDTLPSEFGGGPGDYQLVEEEDTNAQTRLTLVVHSQVGHLDESRVLGRLRTALSNGSRDDRFMAGVWEKAGTFRVRRGIPYASPRGKILPLYIARNSGQAADLRESEPTQARL